MIKLVLFEFKTARGKLEQHMVQLCKYLIYPNMLYLYPIWASANRGLNWHPTMILFYLGTEMLHFVRLRFWPWAVGSVGIRTGVRLKTYLDEKRLMWVLNDKGFFIWIDRWTRNRLMHHGLQDDGTPKRNYNADKRTRPDKEGTNKI